MATQLFFTLDPEQETEHDFKESTEALLARGAVAAAAAATKKGDGQAEP